MMRFIENLWATQAQARLRMTPSTGRLSPRALMSSEETVMESAGEMFGRAKCFCNLLDRRAWSGHPKKVGERTSRA